MSEGKREKEPPCAETMAQWLSGSIRRKLTLFVVVILTLIIGMFWFFSVYLLQPAYERSIRVSLAAALDTVEGILNGVQAEGLPLVTLAVDGGGVQAELSGVCVQRLEAAMQSGALDVSARCLEVAGPDLQNLLLWDNLEARCYLHPSYETGVTARGVLITPELNGELARLVRSRVFENGEFYHTEKGQTIMGRAVAGGQLAATVTVNVEGIPHAVSVLKQLLVPLSLLLVGLSAMAAWAFSRWFTRPISRLSVAAREMAKGNYDVQVQDAGDDEIGDLARDFNQMAREVKRSAEMQRDLIANVSHDLRTPLTLIKGYAETVRDLTGDDAEKRTEQMNVIVDETDRLSGLVGSVLELTRVSSGSEKTEKVRFDLAQLCEEVAYRYETAAAQTGQHFVFTGGEACEVVADPAQVERALHNLLGNAMKHVGADGYIGLSVTRTMHSTARVEVSDHGEGIDEADLPYIFNRYYRSRNDTGKQGTGLGLSITKAIFEANGFAFGVQSKQGEGAMFWFEAKLVSY